MTKMTKFGLMLCVLTLAMLGVEHWIAPAHATTVNVQYFPPPRLAVFTPSGQASISATTSSANVALPTTGASSPIATTVVVTNQDASATAFVLLGTSNAITVTTTTGMPVPPHGSVTLFIGGNTFIAAIGSAAATVGVTTGY
jgi:hypothetical protein